ncbi:MAG: ABC transporter permease [Coriobacteriaceae bacterium]|nr:ABC transporter permease [Coriobacteriaceae bacterium]
MADHLAYWADHADKFAEATLEHLALVGSVLAYSLIIATLITLLVRRSERVGQLVVAILGAVYSVPSLALFSLLIPLTGLGFSTAVVVMVAYNQFLLVRNFTEGLAGVDRDIIEAARGMGMSERQLLMKVQLPLALPMIVAGVRLAAISTIGIATIAATINAGGLGEILFSGLRTMNEYKIVGGTLLCVLVAVIAHAGLLGAETLLRKGLEHR